MCSLRGFRLEVVVLVLAGCFERLDCLSDMVGPLSGFGFSFTQLLLGVRGLRRLFSELGNTLRQPLAYLTVVKKYTPILMQRGSLA